MIRGAALACWLAVCSAVSTPAAAHPHVEMEAKLILMTDASGGRSLRVEWLFDEYYSALILQEHRRTGGKGAFSPAEVAAIRRKQFENVKTFNYFLQPVYDGGKPIKVAAVRDFAAKIEGDRVLYAFTVPLPPPKSPSTPLTVTLSDPENFVKLIMPRHGAVGAEGGGKSGFVCKRIRSPDIVTPNGLIEPDAMRCAPPGKA